MQRKGNENAAANAQRLQEIQTALAAQTAAPSLANNVSPAGLFGSNNFIAAEPNASVTSVTDTAAVSHLQNGNLAAAAAAAAAPSNYKVANGSEPITNKNIFNRSFQLTGAKKGSEPISSEKLSKLLKLYNNSKNDKEKARLKLLASVGKYNTAEDAKTAKNRFGFTRRSVKEVNGKHILSGGRRRLPKSRKTRKSRR